MLTEIFFAYTRADDLGAQASCLRGERSAKTLASGARSGKDACVPRLRFAIAQDSQPSHLPAYQDSAPRDRAPKDASNTRSPSRTRPASTHSSSAMGIEAEDVLPCMEMLE